MNKKAKAIFGFLAILSAPLFAALALNWPEGRPLTVGHRGTRVLADENTIAAYETAWRYGLDLFECDPQLTKDGVYVIMHDQTVDRTTDGHGKVADMTLAQIKALRTASGLEVPTLAEALEFAADHDMAVYLDLKSPPPDNGAKLLAEIDAASMRGRVIAGCWHVQTLKIFEAQAPDITTCVSWPHPTTLLAAKLLGADIIGTLTQLASPLSISMAHQLGLKVITMPINDAGELEKFRGRGLDALQSDDPRLLAPYGRGKREE